MKILSEREYRERLFEEREKADREQRLNNDLIDIRHEIYELKCRIEQLEHKGIV